MSGNSVCPNCRAPVTTTVDNDVAGLPITLHPSPTTRRYALLAIAAGHQAVTAEHDGTWNAQRTRYYALDAWRIPNKRTATQPHYVEHACGVTPPPPDPPQPPPPCTCSWCQSIEGDLECSGTGSRGRQATND